MVDWSKLKSDSSIVNYTIGFMIVIVAGVVVASVVSTPTTPPEYNNKFTSDADQIQMSEIPNEYRGMITTADNQTTRDRPLANPVNLPNMDRDWEPYKGDGEYRSFAVELNRYTGGKVTLDQISRAWSLYKQTYENAEENGWFNRQNAKEDGYYKQDPLHHTNPEYVYNDGDLNPEKPESLLYNKVTKRNETGNYTKYNLVGVMYLKHSFKHGEQVGGPLTIWHHHPYAKRFCPSEKAMELLRWQNDLSKSEIPDGAYNCDKRARKSPEMMHVYFEKRPRGTFATRMRASSNQYSKHDMMDKNEFISFVLDRRQAIMQNTTYN